MTQERTNLLILMADEHTRHVLACYGNDIVKTPNLDRLAVRGTLFRNAYSTSPICVPARAAFASGLYPHQTGNWDNAFGYTGTPQSWGSELQDAGRTVGSIGKLHYRSEDDPTGFDFQTMPMHLVNGIGDVLGAVKDPMPVRWKTRTMAEKIGPGKTSYSNYDSQISDAAVDWLQAREKQGGKEPWTLFVSMVTPHFPLIAPQEFYDLYADIGMMPTKPVEQPEHPWMAAMRACMRYDNFTDEKTRIALASYYGLVSFMDAKMGRILDTLDDLGLTDTTHVVYLSDHGDNIGERGLWGKSVMYEESAGIPAIIAGPGVPRGRECTTPVTHVDMHPTVLENAGLSPLTDRPGRSLLQMADAPDEPERTAFAEYHAAGACSGAFMIRKGRWKLIHYAGFRPSLFDLEGDPGELEDLGEKPKYKDVIADLTAVLYGICDPDEADRRAKADQAAVVEANGGREAVIERGGYGATPAPGEKAEYIASEKV